MVFHFNSSIVLNILSHNGEGDFSTGLGIEIRFPPPSLSSQNKIQFKSCSATKRDDFDLIRIDLQVATNSGEYAGDYMTTNTFK